MKAKFAGGQLDGTDHEISTPPDGKIPSDIKIPFATDKQEVNEYGEIVRVFAYLTYKLETMDCNGEHVFRLVEDDSYRLWQKLRANPELAGAKEL